LGEAGEVVGAGTPILLLSASGQGQVLRGGLSDVEVVQIQLGDRAEIEFDAHPGKVFAATVSEIAAGSDPMTGTFEVELAVEKGQPSLKNGFFGRARLFPNHAKQMLRIPMSAVVEIRDQQVWVYLPDSAQTGFRPASLRAYVLRDDYLTVPPEQLPGEAWIITEGAAYLKAGSRIQLTQPIAVAK